MKEVRSSLVHEDEVKSIIKDFNEKFGTLGLFRDSISTEVDRLKEQINELKDKYMKNNQVKTKLERANQDLQIEEEHLTKKLEIQDGFYPSTDEIHPESIVGVPHLRLCSRRAAAR